MTDSSPTEAPEIAVEEESGANGAAPDSRDTGDLAALRDEIETLRSESTDAKDLARRAQADLANVRRRARAERGEFRSRALEEVCRGFLPVLDDLERAAAEAERAADRSEDGDPNDSARSALGGLREGVRLVLRRFEDTLARQGLMEIEARGAPFDPRLHDAVHRAPAAPGQQDGEVTEVFRRGYLLDGRVIRPAFVVVAVAAADRDEPGEPEAETPGDGPAESRGPSGDTPPERNRNA